jgi:hypothetical protein
MHCPIRVEGIRRPSAHQQWGGRWGLPYVKERSEHAILLESKPIQGHFAIQVSYEDDAHYTPVSWPCLVSLSLARRFQLVVGTYIRSHERADPPPLERVTIEAYEATADAYLVSITIRGMFLLSAVFTTGFDLPWVAIYLSTQHSGLVFARNLFYKQPGIQSIYLNTDVAYVNIIAKDPKW